MNSILGLFRIESLYYNIVIHRMFTYTEAIFSWYFYIKGIRLFSAQCRNVVKKFNFKEKTFLSSPINLPSSICFENVYHCIPNTDYLVYCETYRFCNHFLGFKKVYFLSNNHGNTISVISLCIQ